MIFTAAWNQSLMVFLLAVIVLDVAFPPESAVPTQQSNRVSARGAAFSYIMLDLQRAYFRLSTIKGQTIDFPTTKDFSKRHFKHVMFVGGGVFVCLALPQNREKSLPL